MNQERLKGGRGGDLTLSLEVGQVQRNWPKQGAQSGDPPPEVGWGQWLKQGAQSGDPPPEVGRGQWLKQGEWG